MKEIILAVIVGLFLTIAGLFLEKCYFEENSCPIGSVPTDSASTGETGNPVSEPRGVKPTLASDTFNISYRYRSGDQSEFQDFGKSGLLKETLHTDDYYKIIFKASRKSQGESYVYIFQIDSSDKIFRRFPTTDFAEADKKNVNPVKKGNKYFVPAKNLSFQLDSTTGRETIYTIVTSKPDKDLEDKYESMLAQQDNMTRKQRKAARKEWHKDMKKRGPRPKLVQDTQETIRWKEQEQEFTTKLDRLKKMCDGCVHIVNFKHE